MTKETKKPKLNDKDWEEVKESVDNLKAIMSMEEWREVARTCIELNDMFSGSAPKKDSINSKLTTEEPAKKSDSPKAIDISPEGWERIKKAFATYAGNASDGKTVKNDKDETSSKVKLTPKITNPKK